MLVPAGYVGRVGQGWPISPGWNWAATALTVPTGFELTRASEAAQFSQTGVISYKAVNEPRFTYEGGQFFGLWREGQRSNQVRNNQLGSQVDGTPGTLGPGWSTGLLGCSRTISKTTINGMVGLSIRVFGTTSVAGEMAIQWSGNTTIASADTQTWASTVYLALTAGSLPVTPQLRVNNFTSGGTYVNTTHAQSVTGLTATPQRYGATATLSGVTIAFSAPLLVLGLGSGIVVDFTLFIALGQMERAVFPSSPIRTTEAVTTRAADIILCNNLSTIGYNPMEGKWRFLFRLMSGSAAPSFCLFELNDNTTNNLMSFRKASGGTNSVGFVKVNGTDYISSYVGIASDVDFRTVGYGYKANNCRWAYDGNLAAWSSQPPAIPAMNKMAIGATVLGVDDLFGYIKEVGYTPFRPADEQL